MPLQLALPSGMFRNKRELWIEIHDDDMRKREADAASCATNHSRVLRTHPARLGVLLTSLPLFESPRLLSLLLPKLLGNRGCHSRESPKIGSLGPGSISTEWEVISTTAKNDQQHPSLTNLGEYKSPEPTPFLEKLCLQ
jgi:hypothetical protein